MPLINLEQFKTLFPETKVEISDEQVKWYVKENIYKGSDPVYENGANEQMQLLIEKANELGLKNFKDLFKHAENKQIKESVEAILYLLQGKDISLYQDRTFECGPGTLTNLQSIILDITGAQSLQSVVSRYKKEMLEEFAKELLKKGEMFFKNTLHIRDGMEVHNVTSILNVIADDFGVIKDIKDPYVHNFTDNEVIKKIKDYYTEEIKKLTSGDISGGIVAKLEQSLLEFDKLRINEEDYATRWYFREFSKNVEKYNDEMPQIPHKRLDDDDKKSLFAKILMVTDIGATIGFKDNYRDILKDFIALYLDDKKVIVLDEAEKKEIITKVKIETRSAFTEGEINDEVLKYAIAHDLYIDMGTELSAIDPVQKYLKSGDVLKRQYAIDHIKNNCDKYGGNATEITSQVENPTNAYYTYSDFITQRKFDKASAIARFFDKYNEKVAKSASLDESEKGNTTHIIDLLKAEELRKLREYNAQKEVILSRNKDGKRPLDTLFVNPLFSSITSNDRDSIMSILSEARECTILREVLTAKDKNGYTALHLAADSGNADVVENILAAIGDNKELLKEMLNVKDRYGETALHLAAKSDNADLVEKILTAANDAEVLKDLLTATDVYGETALHLAAESGKTDVVSKILAAIGDNKELLKEVLNVKDRYGYGDTALLSAAKSDKADVVEKILAAIGDNKELLKEMLNVKDRYGDTVLNLAAESGKTDVVEKILAAIGDNKELLKEVLTAKDKNGNTALYLAAVEGKVDVVEKILAAIGDNKELLKEVLTAKDKNGNTALLPAAESGKTGIVEKILAAIGDNKELLKEVLTAKDKNGNTALLPAAIPYLVSWLDKADVVEKILAAIGDNKELLKEMLNVKDKNGNTALYSAVLSGNADLAEKILAAIGNNKELLKEVLIAKDNHRYPVLHYAARLGKVDVVEKILAAIGNNKELLKEVLIAKDNRGETALHHAAYPGNAAVVEKILAAIGDNKELLKEVLIAKDENGDTALYSAVLSGNADLAEKILAAAKDAEVLKDLLIAKNNSGDTALHQAAFLIPHMERSNSDSGKAAVAEKILAAAKDAEVLKDLLIAKNNSGDTALHQAAFLIPHMERSNSDSGKAAVAEKILAAAKDAEVLKDLLIAKNNSGETALHLAAYPGNAAVVEKILDAIGDNNELLKEVLTVKNKDEKTVFLSAVEGRYKAYPGNAAVVEKILDAIGDNNELLKEVLTVKNEDVKRLLRLAAIYGKADVVEKTLDAIGNNKELLKEVLIAKSDYGENLKGNYKNPESNYGNTALYLAVNSGNADVVGKILDAIGDNKELLKEVLIVKNEDEKTVVGLAVTRFATVPTDTSLGKIFEVAKKLDILGEVVGGCGDSFSCLFIKNPVRISDNITLCSSDYFVKECKDLVTPAKWSNIVPSIWVKNTSETGTYWKERDALIEKVVEKYLTDHRYIKTTDKDGNQTYLITEQIDKIKSEIRDNIASHKEEITEFLNEKGHYNVQPKIIKEELEKRDKGGKSFVEKLQEKKSISDTFMPFNVK